MNFRRMLLIILIISSSTILAVSYVQAQTLLFDSNSNTIANVNDITFGFGNATTIPNVNSVTFGFSNATTTNQTTTNSSLSLTHAICVHKLSLELNSIYNSIDITRAKSLTQNNAEFQSKITGYNYTFDSAFLESSFNTIRCSDIIVKDVNVVHDVHDKQGKIIYSVITTLDLTLTKVSKVTEQEPRYQNSGPTANWSGYEVGASRFNWPSTLPTKTVYEAQEEHHIQQVQAPSDPGNACSSTSDYCDSSIWSGLVDTFGGSNGHLVQGGSEAVVQNCNTGCITSYDVWYEFFSFTGPGSVEHICQNVPVSVGDDIVSDVLNNAEIGGSSTTYSINVVDFNQPGQSCYSIQTNYPMSNPVLATFIVERPSDSHKNYVTLPKYNFNPNITGYMFYNGTLHTILNSYQNNEYGAYIMKNPVNSVHGIQNMVPGIVNSGGTFTDTWQSSTNTCAPPQNGDWIITSNCIPGWSINATGNNVVVQNQSVLTITNNTKLTLNFAQNHLLVKSGSGVLITSGSKINK